jgi:outer membrane protein, heavy metal efflux system
MRIAVAVLMVVGACSRASAQMGELRLEEVMDSVSRHYPPLVAALADVEIAEAEALIAEGRFDARLRAGFDSDRGGYYANERFAGGVEQRFRTFGGGIGAGWRRGEGDFAPYDGRLQTRSGGEYRAGLRLPLLRERAVDSDRAGLERARIGRTIARLSVDQQRLIVTQLAARRYWDWVAAGLRYRVAAALLSIAEGRDQMLRDSVQLGQLPAIEITENARAILNRQSEVVGAERFLQQAAIGLSLFLRDATGDPVLAPVDRLPADFPAPELVDERTLLDRVQSALRLRPELEGIEARIGQLRVDERLAANDTLPTVDFGFGLATERGAGPVLRGPNEAKVSLTFELPFQRREAKGRLSRAQAAQRQWEQRLRFATDQVTAEVRDAVSALVAAHDRAALLRRELETARDLEDAERTRLQFGEGTLFMVNLREMATADAAIRQVNALAEYYRAKAQYDYAVARILDPQP